MKKVITKTFAQIYREYKEIKKKHPDSVILYRVGDFYEAYGDDAKKLVEFGTRPAVRACEDSQVDITGFPHHALDTYLPKLVRAGNKVAICEDISKTTQE